MTLSVLGSLGALYLFAALLPLIRTSGYTFVIFLHAFFSLVLCQVLCSLVFISFTSCGFRTIAYKGVFGVSSMIAGLTLCEMGLYALKDAGVPVTGSWQYYVRFAIVLLMELLFYVIFGRKTKRLAYDKRGPLSFIGSLALTLFLIACNVFRTSIVQNQTSNIVFGISIFLVSGLSAFLSSGFLTSYNLNKEKQMLEIVWHQQEEQSALFQQSIDIINAKYHDLRYILASGETSDALEETEEAMHVYGARIQTGNKALDSVLMEKIMFAEAKGIRLTCLVNAENLSFMSSTDLCAFFGNILTNAIEATLRLESEKQIIKLYVSKKEFAVAVKAMNYYQGEIEIKNGSIETTKEDKTNHGFGIKSIKMIVSKYGGKLAFSTQNGVFTLLASFPLSEK